MVVILILLFFSMICVASSDQTDNVVGQFVSSGNFNISQNRAMETYRVSFDSGSINWSPDPPIINGMTRGTKNIEYNYTVSYFDGENDFIQYYIDWGDGTQNTSSFLPNGTTWLVSHFWNASGIYQIVATVTDNSTFSQETNLDVFIDVSFVSTIGFLYDTDNNGQIDAFYINATRAITSIQKTKEGSYYLDTDDDGDWNYLYNPSSGSLTPLRSEVTTIENPWFFIGIICIAIIIIAIIVYLYKKNYF